MRKPWTAIGDIQLVARARSDSGLIQVPRDGLGAARLRLDGPRELPVANEGADERVAGVGTVWNVPYIVRHQHMAGVEVAGTKQSSVAGCIRNVGTVRRSIVETPGPGICDSKEEAVVEASLEVGLHRVIERSAVVLSFNDRRITLVWAQRVRIDALVGREVPGSQRQLIDIRQLLKMVTSAPYVAQSEDTNLLELLFHRHIPPPSFGAGVSVRVGRESERRGVDADAARIVDTAEGHVRRRLKWSVTANVNRIADAETLHVTASSSADDRAGRHLIGKTEARLDVGIDSGRVSAVIAAEETLVAAIEDGIGNVPLSFAGEATARNNDTVQRVSAGNEAGDRVDCWSKRGIVFLLAEKCLVPPERVIRRHDAVADTVLEHEL